MPITFVEREYGDSKMSQRIVVEALLRTTVWGIAHRANQVASLRPPRPVGARADHGRWASDREPCRSLRARRRSWLAPIFVVLLIAIPIVEVWLLVQVGQAIGVLPTIADPGRSRRSSAAG